MRQLNFVFMVKNMMMTPARKEPDLKTYAGRFAARLRDLRINAKLTPEQVAEACGVKLTGYYYWEAGKRTPPLEVFPVLAKTLKLKTVKDLLPEE